MPLWARRRGSRSDDVRSERFAKTLAVGRTLLSLNSMETAYEADYYDQMHMIRDFHDLGGSSLTEVIKEISDGHLISFASR